MEHKKQKKNGFGKKKHYANRMGRHIKKIKKHGRKPLRTPIPYYFATQTPSYIDPIQGSTNLLPVIPPLLDPTPTLPLEPLSLPSLAPQPTLSPLLPPTPVQDPLFFTSTSTLAYDYTYTSTPTPSPSLVYDYTYTSTLAYDYTYTSTPEYTPTPTPVPLAGPVPESAQAPALESEPVSAPQVDGDAIQIVPNETPSEIPQEDTMPEDTSQQQQEQQTIVSDQNNETEDDYPENVVVDSGNEENVPTVSAAAAIARGSNNSQLNSGTLASPNQTMQIAGPIIGIAGVMALVAAAMFLVVKKRRKRRLVQSDSHNREPHHHHQHHQEKERDNDDEAYYFEMPKDSSHTPGETPGAPPTQIPSLAPTSKFYPKNNSEQQQQQQKEENDDDQDSGENRFSHGTGTLVGSQLTSRTNSIKEQKLKHMSVSSWYSAASSLLSLDSPPLPLSGTLVKNNLMLAERQQLQHERPSILDHWKKPIFIETYRAQLADLNDINDSV